MCCGMSCAVRPRCSNLKLKHALAIEAVTRGANEGSNASCCRTHYARSECSDRQRLCCERHRIPAQQLPPTRDRVPIHISLESLRVPLSPKLKQKLRLYRVSSSKLAELFFFGHNKNNPPSRKSGYGLLLGCRSGLDGEHFEMNYF